MHCIGLLVTVRHYGCHKKLRDIVRMKRPPRALEWLTHQLKYP